MRASRQEQTGGIGQNEVAANFERLGWGPVPNPYHDVGTDLFLQVRDERGVDLGLIVGAQVKSGPSAFDEPRREGDELAGWWFRDSDRRHIDAWLRHSVPHLIVLHDLDTRKSYWAQISDETVEDTGVGAKVFVPRSHVVDAASRDALLEIAGARRPGVTWEGSVWMAGAGIIAADRLRHALIVPRLVAPHPNAGTQQAPTADQAVAMVMQARLSELDAFAEQHPGVPGMTEAAHADEWAWRFAGALHARVVHSEIDPLLGSLEDAGTAEARAAATAAAVTALVEDGRIAEALECADAAVDRDDIESVDHAWLLVQRARARVEIGRIATAQDDALRAQGIRLTFANDATATAIGASAARLLFNTSSWGAKDLRALITHADTAANWWRTQTTARGLWAVADRAFAAANRGVPIQDADGDPGYNNLAAAALMAGHAGDQSAWRSLFAAAAKNELLRADRDDEPGVVAEAVTMLRRAGDHKAVEQVVRRLIHDGPAAAVTVAAAHVDLDASTRTTGQADLMLLEHAADVLDEDTRTRVIGWLLKTLVDPSRFAERTTPRYLLRTKLIETPARVASGGEPRHETAVVDHILALEPMEVELERYAWTRTVKALSDEAWTADRAMELRDAADRHEGSLRLALLGAARAAGDDSAEATLLNEAAAGSIGAVTALGDVRRLPADAITAQIASLSASVARFIAEAHEGRQSVGGPDPAADLALINAWHAEAAAWEPVFELLADGAVIADAKRRTLQMLTALADKLTPPARERLQPLAVALANTDPAAIQGLFDDGYSIRHEAALLAAALGALDEAQTAERLVELLHGDHAARRRALALADRSDVTGVIVALTADPQPEVRAEAVAILARRLEGGDDDELTVQVLRAAVHDPGTRVPEAIAGTFRDAATALGSELRDSLRCHPSARVRRVARGN
jgi:hypothetical protein